MAEGRSEKLQNPVESPEAALLRLIAANERLQAEVVAHLASEKQWQVERALFRAVIDQVPDHLFAKNRDGTIVLANRAITRDLGVNSDDLVGRTDFDLHSPEVAARFVADDQKVLASGESLLDIEEFVVGAAGEKKWLSTSKVPLVDERDHVIGVLGISRDVTERKLAEQAFAAERVLFRAMIDQVPDYLFVKDTESRFVIANRALAADLGRRPDDLIGKTDFELHQRELAVKFIADEQRVIRSGEPLLDIDEYVVDTSGNKQWLSTSKVPLRNDQNEVIGIVGIARNVTERKRAEDQIRHMALHDALTGLPNRSLLMDRSLRPSSKRSDRSAARPWFSSISTISSSSTTASATTPATSFSRS